MRVVLFAVILVATVGMGACGATQRPPMVTAAMTQEQAVAEIQKWGGKVVRDGTTPDAPVVAVVFDRKGTTDGGLPYLSVLKQLQTLDLSASKVTDAGLEHLSALNQLQSLNLNFTEVTDAGLEYLSSLKQLQKLFLYTTKATVPGVKKLQEALPACEIGRDAGQSPLYSAGGRAKRRE